MLLEITATSIARTTMSCKATSSPSTHSIHTIPVDGNSGYNGILDDDEIPDGDFLPNEERPCQRMQLPA